MASLKALLKRQDEAYEAYKKAVEAVDKEQKKLQSVCSHPKEALEYVGDNSYTECGNAQVDYDATERYYECQLCHSRVTKEVEKLRF